MQSKPKNCQGCKYKFTIEPEDFKFYNKIGVPEPTFCPECRTKRRFAFRNESKLFKRKDDFSGKDLISMHPQNSQIKVYDNNIWRSDKWDPLGYGRGYNFSRPFFDQFAELILAVPWKSRTVLRCVNSDYCTNAVGLKNCYLVSNATNNEDCAYCVFIEKSKDCYDCYHLIECELCYESVTLVRCYQTFFSNMCKDSRNLFFCKNCADCSDCFGCINLKHKKYYIFNKKYSKEECFRKLKEFGIERNDCIDTLKKQTQKEHWKYPVRFMNGKKNNNVTGQHINNSKDAFNSYMVNNVENVKHFQFSILNETKDCYDCTVVGWAASRVYESTVIGDRTYDIKFCLECWPDVRELEYCAYCQSSSNLFACVGLRHKQYCIFNKQYTKEEYLELVPKIKAQMNELPFVDKNGNVYKYGEFFPPEIFPFCYNNTIAQEYFPLTKEEALEKGYNWYDKPKSEYEPTIKAKDLPDNIKDAKEEILSEIIQCANEKEGACQGSGVYQIIPTELEFLKKHRLPLPRLCPDCRHTERIKQRNPMQLHKRQCMCNGQKDTTEIYTNQQEHNHKDQRCPNAFQTTYAPEREEIVYCKECYQREVE